MVLCQLKLDTLEPGKRGVKDPAPLSELKQVLREGLY